MGFEEGRTRREGWERLAVCLVSLLFFVGSLVLVNPARLTVSPDETANAYFAALFSETGSFRGAVDELSASFDGRVHPRSTVSVQGVLLPGSFLGLPFLYGAVAAAVGVWSFWILTPLITIAAALAWGRVIERFTRPLIGRLSFALFLLHPAVWYYSARSLMHNVLFVDLLVLSVWLWTLRPLKRTSARGVVNDVFSGLLLGLALFVRASEAPWIALALLLAGAFWWREVSLRRCMAAFLGMTPALVLLFGMNALTYGDPFTTGYTVQPALVETLQATDTLDTVALFPFGLRPEIAWQNLRTYGIEMFWWLSPLALLGFFVLSARKAHRRSVRAGLAIAALISLWLVLLYGSWEIHDNPDPMQATMANSYIRYWLPLFLFSTPLIAAALVWIAERGRSRLSRGVLLATLCLLVASFNVRVVFLQGEDALLSMRGTLESSAQIQASVLRLTPGSAVIIVDRADKIFFPHRRVWMTLRDEATYAAMPELVRQAPLYYYGITLPEADMAYLNEARLKRMNLQIELVETYDQESLYRLWQP